MRVLADTSRVFDTNSDCTTTCVASQNDATWLQFSDACWEAAPSHGRSSGRPTDAMFTTTVCRDRIVAHGDQWRWTPSGAERSGAGSSAVRLRRSATAVGNGSAKTYDRGRPSEPILALAPTCTRVVLAGSRLDRAQINDLTDIYLSYDRLATVATWRIGRRQTVSCKAVVIQRSARRGRQ